MVEFRSSIEGAWRRYLRSAVRHSAMTPGQKAVTTAILNLWLHHRNGPKGYIHPGRAKIAKAAKVTEKTVSRTMAVLRTAGVLRVRRRLHGEGQHPTEYTMGLVPMLELCGAEIPEWTEGELTEIPIIDAKWRDKCPTTYGRNVSPLAGQNVPQSTTNAKTHQSASFERVGDEHE